MKLRRNRSRATSVPPCQPPLDQQAIDERYGLEPVFEPEQGAATRGAGGASFTTVQCPYCGEPFDTLVDLSAGSALCIEDCQVCCQPIELDIQVAVSGRLRAVTARRGD